MASSSSDVNQQQSDGESQQFGKDSLEGGKQVDALEQETISRSVFGNKVGFDEPSDLSEGGTGHEEGESQKDTEQPISQTALILQVRDTLFSILPITLLESKMLRSLASTTWLNPLTETHPSNKKFRDGSVRYFLDIDPVLFTHILRYLQHSSLPIFYDDIRGHDYALYESLLLEADYLIIPRLVKWLKTKQYLKAVKATHKVKVLRGATEIENFTIEEEVLAAPPIPSTEQEYVCPRGLKQHMGDVENCGKVCGKVQRQVGERIYRSVPVLTLVLKKIEIAHEMCLTYAQDERNTNEWVWE